MTTRLGIALCSLAASVLTGTAATSSAIFVKAEVQNPHWNRIFGQTIPLAWDWDWEWVPESAAKVNLRIEGMNSTIEETYAKPVTQYLWTVYTDLAGFREDSYRTTLTFLDAGNAPLTNITVRLDALMGAFSGADVRAVSTNDPAWKRVAGSVLIPYDGTWVTSTVQAATASLAWSQDATQISATNLTDSAVGMAPWVHARWSQGEYRIDLSFDGSGTPTWTAFVTLAATRGTIFSVR